MDVIAVGGEELKDWAVDAPLRILLIALGAAIVARIARRGVRGALSRVAEARLAERLSGIRPSAEASAEREAEIARGRQRIEALGAVLASAATFVIAMIAAFMALAELGVNLGPLLAGAGVVGLAIGFGAQALVKDVVTGAFILLEDQFAVGDTINLGEDAEGVVEDVSLRSTRLRGEDGTVWYVPNGEIKRVANRSQ